MFLYFNFKNSHFSLFCYPLRTVLGLLYPESKEKKKNNTAEEKIVIIEGNFGLNFNEKVLLL